MAGTSGCIPDFEVNVFGQLCQPARRPSAKVGTSGCLPDFEVNVFGQLCKPAHRPSSPPSSEDQEPDVDAQGQANATPAASTCITDYVPKPDPVFELVQKNQILIQSLSGGNGDDYIATVKRVFKEVRQSRGDAGADPVERQGMAVQIQEHLEEEAEPCLQHKERERDQNEYQSRRRSQSQLFSSAQRFTIKHYEQDEDEDEDEATLFCREQRKRKGDGICSHVIM